MDNKIVIHWYRRDLRLNDNAALHNAIRSGHKVLPIFIFDTDILEKLDDKEDRRVDYIHQALSIINQELKQFGSGVLTFHGSPLDVFKKMIAKYDVRAVYCNRDYEPQAIERDNSIKTFLNEHGVQFYDHKDQVIFEQKEIVKNDGFPYTVFTPYSKKWLEKLDDELLKPYSADLQCLFKFNASEIHSLDEIGFRKTDLQFKQPQLDLDIIKDYDKFRDYPAMDLTTRLGIALRFGTISIRECVAFAAKHNQTWLSELIWREFFMQILFNYPRVVDSCFKSQYENIEWRNNEEEFDLWCKGKTGYPLVDAGMRQLISTGYMHNRVRMVVASFLCKHLLIDWRWGEAYFAEKLLDYDLSANNGNWQWAAGCGCDAAPYFRIFNPTAQMQKFDKDLKYIRRWYPEIDNELLSPIVQHDFARKRALEVYGKAVKQNA